MTTLRPITTKETFAVRHPVLRRGKPAESCFFDGDDLPTTRHFGAFVDKNLIGVVSVYQNKSPNFSNNNQYQIRGMAVLDDFRKKGLGELLVVEVEHYVSGLHGDLIWFNAREAAVGFYEKMGYQRTGEPFEIGDIGPHCIMFKKFGKTAYE